MEKIIFMGTPDIAARVMQKMLDAGANITLAVTQPDRKTGRRQKLEACAVKKLAEKYNIDVFQPQSIRSDYERLVQEKPDLIVTCAYGQIVPQAVLDIPRVACVNLHGSLLPEYRGAAPIQRALWDGKKKTGMSLMKMEAGMDTGPVMACAETEINDEDTSSVLFERLGDLAGDLIVSQLDTLLHGSPMFQPQDEKMATYAPKITREEEKIDLNQPDSCIINQIRALAQTPGAYVMAQGKKLKILQASYIPYTAHNPDGLQPQQPGTFEACGKKKLLLHLHDGALQLKRLQLEGKPVMETAAFMNGHGKNLTGKKAE